MSNFDQSNQVSVSKFILDNLGRHSLMAIATVDNQNLPWVVCVNLSYDNNLNIYWKSATAANHSKNISYNQNVSICIFSHSSEVGDFGFYCKSYAHEVLSEDELKLAIDVKYTKKGLPTPPASDFLDSSNRRMYCAVITEAWINDDRHMKTLVDLDELRKQAKLI